MATRAYVRKDTREPIVKRVCIVKKKSFGIGNGNFWKNLTQIASIYVLKIILVECCFDELRLDLMGRKTF